MDENFFDVLRSMGLEAINPVDVINKIVQETELEMLKKMRERISSRMKELSVEKQPTSSLPVEEPDISIDPFQVLGVKQGDSEEKVRAAYRKQARVHHPDMTGDANSPEIVRINAAYDAIKMIYGWK